MSRPASGCNPFTFLSRPSHRSHFARAVIRGPATRRTCCTLRAASQDCRVLPGVLVQGVDGANDQAIRPIPAAGYHTEPPGHHAALWQRRQGHVGPGHRWDRPPSTAVGLRRCQPTRPAAAATPKETTPPTHPKEAEDQQFPFRVRVRRPGAQRQPGLRRVRPHRDRGRDFRPRLSGPTARTPAAAPTATEPEPATALLAPAVPASPGPQHPDPEPEPVIEPELPAGPAPPGAEQHGPAPALRRAEPQRRAEPDQ